MVVFIDDVKAFQEFEKIKQTFIPTKFITVKNNTAWKKIKIKQGWYKFQSETSIWVYEHYVNNVLHKDVGPARIEMLLPDDKIVYSVDYYQNGELHNLNGPASIYTDGPNEIFYIYAIEGVEMSKQTFLCHPKVLNQKINSILSL